MTKPKRPNFNPEVHLDAAKLVLEQNYSVVEAAKAMGVGKSTMDKWVRQLRSELRGESPKATPMTNEQRRIRELEQQVKTPCNGKRHSKKGFSSLNVGRAERFALIQRLQESYPANHLCQLFCVHRSSYRHMLVDSRLRAE